MKTQDRELLELAAKAAGLHNPRYVSETSWGTGISHGEGDEVYRVWNPLRNDGDALRLTVKLKLRLATACNQADQSVASAVDNYISGCVEDHGNDPCAATRRCITRAAAEIGKGME